MLPILAGLILFLYLLPNYDDESPLDLGTFELFLTKTNIYFVALILDISFMYKLFLHTLYIFKQIILYYNTI